MNSDDDISSIAVLLIKKLHKTNGIHVIDKNSYENCIRDWTFSDHFSTALVRLGSIEFIKNIGSTVNTSIILIHTAYTPTSSLFLSIDNKTTSILKYIVHSIKATQ